MRHTLHLFMTASLLGGLASLSAGCGSDAPPMGEAIPVRDSLPVMVTKGVSKLITDSGIVRYKMIAEEWHIFDKTNPPRWEFPKGIFIERYDNKFKVDLHLTADSAWLYNQNLWKLRGHIQMHNKADGTRLTTEELYWNMRTGELSSNVYTRLVEPHQAIEGDWFRARIVNNEPTEYHIRQSKGFLPMGDIRESTAPVTVTGEATDDTTAVDTLPQREAPRSRRKFEVQPLER